MTQEDKELLLKDLCAKLPYGVRVLLSDEDVETLNLIEWNKIIQDWYIRAGIYIGVSLDIIKPYLRSMSSMTEEEKDEYDNIVYGITNIGSKYEYYDLVDWLNKKMFDYRGLIDKGLALEAPEGMYK